MSKSSNPLLFAVNKPPQNKKILEEATQEDENDCVLQEINFE